MATAFVDVYNRFLGQITDDLYVELTPEDTIRDLRELLVNSLPGFEFPRKNLFDYQIIDEVVNEEDVTDDDFVIGAVTDSTDEDLDGEESQDTESEEPGPAQVKIEKSFFECDLTPEEILIISKLMLDNWLQRQITSIENTRMKYSGTDFKMTSQANHLSKLVTLQDKVKQQAHHYQRLYRRRRTEDGLYRSNWDIFKKTNYYYD